MNTYAEIEAIKASASIDVINIVLYQALNKSAVTTVDGASRYCAAHSFEAAESFLGAISLLERVGLIAISDGTISISMDDESYRSCQSDLRLLSTEVANSLFKLLARTMSLSYLFPPGSLSYSSEENHLLINENLIPFRLRNIKFILINLGVLKRLNSYGLLSIEPGYKSYFENTVIPAISSEISAGGTDLDSLRRALKQREERGEAAEKYVVDYERKRLAGHRNIGLIKRVSVENISCGYDILSFESTDSAAIDRFIEVKSFRGPLRFYWTRNEVNVSKILENRYYLYLIDSGRFEDIGYTPVIIQNPQRVLFSESSKYGVETEVFVIELKS